MEMLSRTGISDIKKKDNQLFTAWSVQRFQGWMIRKLRAVASVKSHYPWPSSSFTPGFHWLKERPDSMEEGPGNTMAMYMVMCTQFFPQGDLWTLNQATIKYGKGNAQTFWELDTGSRLPSWCPVTVGTYENQAIKCNGLRPGSTDLFSGHFFSFSLCNWNKHTW